MSNHTLAQPGSQPTPAQALIICGLAFIITGVVAVLNPQVGTALLVACAVASLTLAAIRLFRGTPPSPPCLHGHLRRR